MPAFAYRAVDRSGKRLRGAEEAPSPRALTLTLEARGLLVVAVAESAAGAGTVALMVLAFFVLPRFAELLQSTGAALPRSTALVLAIANGMRHGWPLLLGGVAALPLVVIWSRQTDDGRRAVSRFLIGAP